MPTLKLYFNSVNSIPLSTDPVHYRSFTVDVVNDREIEEVKERTPLLNRSIVEDMIGIRRKLKFFLRVQDIRENIDYLTSYFNAPFQWVLMPDSGYYFNLGTLASPVAVPTVTEKVDAELSVSALLSEGISVITKDVYPRPSAPALTEIGSTWESVEVAFTGNALKYRLFKSNSSGGTLSLLQAGSSSPVIGSGLTENTTYYFKGSVVTLGGESELSAEIDITTATI